MGSKIIADNGHDAGLHCTQGDEEKGLPLVVKPQGGNGFIAEGGKNQIQSQDVKGIGRLHQNIWQSQAENLPDVVGEKCRLWWPAEALAHHNQGGHHLPCDGSHGSAGNAHFQAENQQRVQQDVGHRTQNLGKHGRFHIAVGLQHLCPGALQKQPKAKNTYNPAIGHHVRNHGLGIGGHPGIGGHDCPTDGGEQQPQCSSQGRAHTGIFICFFSVTDAQLCSHHGVDAHTGSDGKGNHQQLQGINDG